MSPTTTTTTTTTTSTTTTTQPRPKYGRLELNPPHRRKPPNINPNAIKITSDMLPSNQSTLSH